ncbi:MAG: glycosyltransferase family 2 protein [Candidatus Bathyarchaeia archaeon]
MVEVERERFIIESEAFFEFNPFIVIGIPAFNEEASIEKVVRRARQFADAVVVCDDGSTDSTASIAESLGASVVKHSQNLGYGSAIQSLLRCARALDADVLVTLDADGQHDPAEIPRLLNPLASKEADIVVGSRFMDEEGTDEMPLYRKTGVRLITKMLNAVTRRNISDAQSGLRAYNRSALELIHVSEKGMGASVEILLDASNKGLRICEVPSTCKYKVAPNVKTSKENPFTHGLGVVASLLKLMMRKRPLTFLALPGIAFLSIGALFGAWIWQTYAEAHYILTNIALVSLSFTLLGALTFSVAMGLRFVKHFSDELTHGGEYR